MVLRSVFYVKGESIMQRIVQIAWDLGFDTFAKHKYIERIRLASQLNSNSFIDVTSASDNIKGRFLSPVFVKVKGRDISVEDYLRSLQEHIPDLWNIAGISDYVYLTNLNNNHIDILMQYEYYSDVFHNPQKSYGNTQACSLAIYKLLYVQGKLQLLENLEEFLNWYQHINFEKEFISE